MTSLQDIKNLEEELQRLTKERDDSERKCRELEGKERRIKADIDRRNGRTGVSTISGKRTRDDARNKPIHAENTNDEGKEEQIGDEKKLEEDEKKTEDLEENKEVKVIEEDIIDTSLGEEEQQTKRTKIEEPDNRRPKLSSAVMAPSTGKGNQESQAKEAKPEAKRNRRMFGVMLGTLQKFKNDLNSQSQAALKRQQIEKEVEEKMKKERETLTEKVSQELTEEKEKTQLKRDELKKQVEEKTQELINLKAQRQRNIFNKYFKTEAKPSIYYKPVDQSPEPQNGNNVVKDETKKESLRTRRGRSRSRSSSRSRSRSPAAATEEKVKDEEIMEDVETK